MNIKQIDPYQENTIKQISLTSTLPTSPNIQYFNWNLGKDVRVEVKIVSTELKASHIDKLKEILETLKPVEE